MTHNLIYSRRQLHKTGKTKVITLDQQKTDFSFWNQNCCQKELIILLELRNCVAVGDTILSLMSLKVTINWSLVVTFISLTPKCVTLIILNINQILKIHTCSL